MNESCNYPKNGKIKCHKIQQSNNKPKIRGTFGLHIENMSKIDIFLYLMCMLITFFILVTFYNF